ncbi:hypothetical protein QVD17_00116 [Tagetes erecta]|uniref:Uncharacterized protein n=1 Tax=Tagetes erecta TaxID=13708 RepID=A0AAD8L405_TARER|nr:hypothetical protein QVD17_00116 [Tagetes erecta]
MATDIIHKVTSGIASKVTNIDGNPICGILKKSAAQGAVAATADMSSKVLGESYAEKTKATNGLESDKVKVGKNRVNFQFMQSKDEYPEADVVLSRIDIIMDGGGKFHEGDNVQKAFVTHYEKFLGCEGDTSIESAPDLFIVRLDDTIANRMEMM